MSLKFFNKAFMALAVCAAGFAFLRADDPLMSRDIGCSALSSPRQLEMCRTLSASMEWTWFGHAILSPGWRITFDSVREAYCSLKPGPGDIPDLDAMKHLSHVDWRLESGADDLSRLIAPRTEDKGSIFDPQNPAYILKDGCPSP